MLTVYFSENNEGFFNITEFMLPEKNILIINCIIYCLKIFTYIGEGMDILKREIFTHLKIIRVYTKKIGKPIEKKDPVVLKQGTTLIDAAEYIHKDFKKNLRFARLWNESGYTGQKVEKNHILNDRDVVEFHV